MTEQTQIIKSPVGTINFLAHVTPKYNDYKKRDEYSCRLEIDKGAEGAEEFLKMIRAINKNLGSEDGVKQEGNFFLNGSSKVPPKIIDASGKILLGDEIPMVDSSDGKSTARLILQEFKSKNPKMGGGLGLVAIQLINYTEYEGAEQPSDDDVLAALNG